jgi:hypothetical protein
MNILCIYYVFIKVSPDLIFFWKNTEFIIDGKIPNKNGNFRKRSEEAQTISDSDFVSTDFVSVFSVTVSVFV